MVHEHARLAMAMLAGVLAGSAVAQDLPPLAIPSDGPVHKTRGPHGRKGAVAIAPDTLQRAAHDLLHGDATQREWEREDNDAASTRPIDHSRDEFAHEVKGQ